MHSTDCLILGFYDYPFAEYVDMVQAMGTDSGAYQDLALAFTEYAGRPMRALDLLTHFFYEDRPAPHVPFHNADFLWPVVAYLSSYLRRRGHTVDYVNLPHFEQDGLHRKLQEGTQAVAITTTLYVSPHPILDLVELIREHNNEAKIIVGGPYISNQKSVLDRQALSRLLEYLGGDIYVLCQEGEATLSAVLDALKKKAPLDLIPNLAFRNATGGFTFTLDNAEANSLTENIIDYSIFDRSSLGEFLSIRTAKSCPYACSFCGFPQRAGAYKVLDVSQVEQLLNQVADLGRVTTLTFIDDTFNVPKSRFKEILRMMIRNDYGFKWNCFYRSDQGDAEAIELMSRAGCEGAFLGVESGSDYMLAQMNKTARRTHFAQAIPLLNAAGISTYASLIVGFPGETEATIRETIDLLEEAAPEFYRAQLWYADPMTPIWKKREELGITGLGFNWGHYTMHVREACEWIDRMFLEVQNSTWLPQFGFEQWSTFYLARKGMTRQQIRTFLHCFNAAVKSGIVTGKSELPAELIDELRVSSQFDRPESSRAQIPARWSGRAYREAMQVLANEFKGSRSFLPGLPADLERPWKFSTRRATISEAHTYTPEILAAAYALVLAETNPNVHLLTHLNRPGDVPIPLAFANFPQGSFVDWLEEVQRKIQAIAPHQQFAAAICASRLWRKEHQLEGLTFPYAMVWNLDAEVDLPGNWMPFSFRAGVEEVLEARCIGNRLTLTMRSRGINPHDRDGEDRLFKIVSVLEAVATRPAMKLTDVRSCFETQFSKSF
jgi:anaerobic magnesium-protoporphyrin IX monomethyl ester cyclase